MVKAAEPMTLEQFLARPETKPASEYACGEVHRKPMPTDPHGVLQPYIWLLIFEYLRTRRLGRVRTEWRCVFDVPGARRSYVPDVVYVSFERLPPGDPAERTHLRVPPDLVVEVLSPGESARRFAAKLRFYLMHGVRLVWVVDPRSRTITVYDAQQPEERLLRAADMLDGGEVLPGFGAAVSDIFAQIDPEKP